VKEINVIPFKGGFTKRIEIPRASTLDVNIDGQINEDVWNSTQGVEFSSYTVKSLSDDENLYFSLSFDSEQDIINPFTDGGMWNGDGFEIAFTNNHELGKKRVFMSSTDQHFIVNLDNKYVWDYRNSKLLEGIKVAKSKNNGTYQFEIQVPLSSLNLDPFTTDVKYQMEFAVGKSSADGTKREMQYKWNSEGKDGFYAKPALWGEMTLVPID
ncbi:MAG: sugar-binding protein, partial [Flavobacteriales bacterium]|nr:sugar-binding protein [Flavobacteriales bacterium]